ncbi:hypothetical protein EDB19DRAFT_1828440 [Suillus lakei]|nr:hypothetical protein EDB19DRAFT_1828440 [Suillus lakei]
MPSVIKVARNTLTRVGVKLYLFVVCSQTLLPLKSAYFEMLVLIRRRKHTFPSELDDRINRLLLPLYTHLVIRCGGVDTRAQLGINELLVAPDAPAAGKRANLPVAPAAAVSSAPKPIAADVMPPPDAFAKKKARIDRLEEIMKQRSTRGSHAQTHLVPKQYPPGDVKSSGSGGKCLVPKQYPAGDPGDNGAKPLVPEEYPAAEAKPGDNGGSSRPRRVFTRTNAQYFGIFCTGKRPVTSSRTVCID